MSKIVAPRVPRYRRHKSTNQAVVTLDATDIYLGLWNSKASRREYDRLIGEWLANGRQLPRRTAAYDTTVVELCAAYWRWAKTYYVKDGKLTGSIERVRVALALLRQVYGPTRASEFGPLALKSLQLRFVRDGKSRRYVNHLVEQIKRVFKWGVSQEMVPASVFQALATVAGLRKGRTEAREPKPVLPVAQAVVDATLPHLPAVVADMVRFQQLTGCRPGEVCLLRPCDVDRSDHVWAYRPLSHKTEHHGRERVIFIGPQAQQILSPYLLRESEAFCFTPAESERKRLERRTAARTTPLCCGNRPGSNRVGKRKLPPGSRYNNGAYANVVRRCCDQIDAMLRKQAAERGEKIAGNVRLFERWRPNQLRHAAATMVRKKFGLEASQVVLGHARADITQVYAERDLALAARVAAEVG